MSQHHHTGYASVEERNKDLLAKTPSTVPAGAKSALIAGSVLGVVGLAWGFATHDPIMWAAVLINFMLLAGITVGGPVFAAILSIVGAQWGRPVKRLAELTIFYAPLAFGLLIVLVIGADQIWEWTLPHDEIHLHGAKSHWLSKGFVLARAFLWLGILVLLGRLYVKKSIRPDAGLAQETDASWGARECNRQAAENFSNVAEEVEKSHHFLTYLSPWLAFTYAVCFAMLGYDLVMSLDPHWFSTMFGGWMFMQNLLATVSFIGIVAFTAKHAYHLDDLIGDQQHHDLGKLTFGASIFWAYLTFAQVIVIWYGNLPEEIGYFKLRIEGQWAPVAVAAGVMCWAFPFLVLMRKAHKINPTIYRGTALVILAGIWTNFYLLITPAVLKLAEHHGHEVHGIMPTVPAILVTIGAVSSFVLVYLRSLTKYPIAPISDPHFVLPKAHL